MSRNFQMKKPIVALLLFFILSTQGHTQSIFLPQAATTYPGSVSNSPGSGSPLYTDVFGFLLSDVRSIYNATPSNLTTGTSSQLQSDIQGNLRVYLASQIYGEDSTNNVIGVVNKPIITVTYSPAVDTSFGTLVTHNAKSGAGLLQSFTVSNVGATLVWFQIYNSTGTTTGSPLLSFPVPAGSATVPGILSISSPFFSSNGLYFSTGITWAISTVQSTYTAGTAANYNINLIYN